MTGRFSHLAALVDEARGYLRDKYDGRCTCLDGGACLVHGRRGPDCTCLEYGHGLTLTRVISRSCPVHAGAANSQSKAVPPSEAT